MKKKNTKQYFDGGNILSLLGGLNNVIPSDTTAGGAASGAISGASSMATTGNPYLIGAGALLGGIGGGIQGYKQNMNNQINPYTDGVDQRNKMLNIMADGGFLTSFDGGYTHDDPNPNNVNGGIPQGIAPDGRLNTVEPPEAKGIIPSIKNFVYSANPDFIITKDMIKGTNLPNYVIGKVPAKAARMINDKLKDNPNNKIVKETTEILLNQVKDINEVMAMGKNSKNMLKNGGPIQHNQGRYADGGYLSPSQYSQQMQLKDFDPSIPQMQPRIDQLPIPEQKLDTRLNRIPLDFLGTARNLWSIQDQNLLNTPNMPDRSKGISPQMVSAGQQARDYNANINDYLRDVGRILNKSYIEGDTRPENEIIRDIVGDYDKQPLTTKTFSDGGNIHIDPKNKGKFTQKANSMGMSVQEAASHILANKDNYSPTTIKRANFAKNASHWQHAVGGPNYTKQQLDSIVARANSNPQLLTADERNFVERMGDKLYSTYENNKPELLQVIGDFDPFEYGIQYLTGHTPQMTDAFGNPIMGGAAPTMGGNFRLTPKRLAKSAAKTKKFNEEFGTLLDDISKAKSGLNIPKELEGTVDFVKNKEISPELIQGLKKGLGYGAGAIGAGAGLYGVGSLISDGLNNKHIQESNISTSNYSKNYDPLNVFGRGNKKYGLPNNENYISTNSNEGYNNTQQFNTGPSIQTPEYAVSDKGVKKPQTSQIFSGNIGDFYDPTNPSLPFDGPNWTRRGYFGNDFDTQNEWVKGQLSPQNIKMWLDPSSELNKGVPWRQEYINIIKQQQPKLYEDLLANKVPLDKLQELYTEKEVGPIQSLVDFPQQPLGTGRNDQPLQKMTPRTPTVDFPKFGLAPMSPKQPTVEEPGTPPTNINVPNLWPEAGLLSALPYAGLKPNLANPTLMSTGYLKPQLTDEMTMRSGIDQANAANIGAIANATAGSAGAQRAGLLGSGANYMNAINNAFMQSNQANNQARMAADQFNIQNQTGVAGNNMGALNQFELENKELINNINAKKADEFANTLGNYVENGYRRRAAGDLENARRNEIEAFTGYNIPKYQRSIQLTPGTPGIPQHDLTWDEWTRNQNKLVNNVKFCNGGTIKRSLK